MIGIYWGCNAPSFFIARFERMVLGNRGSGVRKKKDRHARLSLTYPKSATNLPILTGIKIAPEPFRRDWM